MTAQCCFSIPPENIRKPLGFLMFSGGIEKQHSGSDGLQAGTHLHYKVSQFAYTCSKSTMKTPK